jgi:hypothetical protein
MKRFYWAFAMITGLILSNQTFAATQYEAENATLSGGANRNTNHAGYSGTGFVDGFFNSSSAQVSFAVTGATAGSYTISLRYSAGNGTSTNTGLYINGTKIKNITCNATTNWDTWADETETVTLITGNNTIAYKADASSSSCINIDYISVNALDPCTGLQGGGAGLKGTVFGLNPPWSAGSEYCKATDGDINTFYDYSQANGAYTGLDFGSAKVIGKIRYYPRSGSAGRMTNGKFQGSNDGSSYTDLYTISSTPPVQWNEVTISNSTGYRYVRYLAPDGGYGNIAEMEFYPGQTTYSLTMNNDGRGATSPSGTVTVNAGSATSISATPSSGYQFSGWTVTSGTATIANPSSAGTTVTLTSGNATVQANFVPMTYSLMVSNDGYGSTTPSGTVTVNHGAATSITATPASGYQFSNWTVTTGTATIANPTSASTTVTLTSGSATIRANFTSLTYSLTMSNDGHGSTTPTGTVTVNHGAATSITATPASGYQFSNWTVTSGTATIANPTSASTTVTLTSGSATIRANFTSLTYSLTMSNDGHGSTTPTGTVTVNHGAATSITATPSSGYQFSNWTVTSGSATIANPTSASTTVTLTSGSATIRANFTVLTYSLTMSNDGHGSTTPTGIVTVNHGAATSITATPASGYQFMNWTVTTGTATIANPTSASTTVTLTSGSATIRANFTALTYSLTMSNDGHGSTTPTGTVTVNHGAATSITATPSGGYQFMNWTVTTGTATIANPTSASTTVTLTSGSATIRANFTQQIDTLTISNNGNGSTVPSGTLYVNRGAPTAISATANSGFHFTSWTVVSGTAQIANPASSSTTVTLTSGNAAIMANFSQDLPILPNNRQISISGSLYDGNGNPIGSPTPRTVEMTVRLCSQATGGDTLYTEDFLVQNAQGIVVDNGSFVVRLGTGVAGSDLLSVISANENLWAEITVLGDQPDVLLPRTPVTASPYSLSGASGTVRP